MLIKFPIFESEVSQEAPHIFEVLFFFTNSTEIAIIDQEL